MEKDDKIRYVFKRLKELKKALKTMTYKELGEEIDTHYRHVYKTASYTQFAIEVYNKHLKFDVPMLNALVVNAATRRPGNGCATENPADVFRYDYEPHYADIEKILEFIIEMKNHILWEDGYIDTIEDLYYHKLLVGFPDKKN